MPVKKQETIYLEADEDITSAIDKLHKTKASAVAIVAPKRSTLVQSLINLRLLKKTAEDTGKFLVLVTSDRTATHLAGRLGIDVASTLGGRASIPAVAGKAPVDRPEVMTEEADGDVAVAGAATAAASSSASGIAGASQSAVSSALAGAALATATKPAAGRGQQMPVLDPTVDSVGGPHDPTDEFDSQDDPDFEPDSEPIITTTRINAASILPAASAQTESSDSAAKPKLLGHGLGTHVPNITVMQKRLVIGGLALTAIIGLWVTNVFISHATINIYARGTALKNDLGFSIDPTAKSTDAAGSVVMGQLVTASRDATAPLTATGKKDVGTKATGEVTIYNNYDAANHAIPAGTRLVSSDGKAFVTKAATVVPGLTVVVLPGPKLSTVPGSSGPVPVEAIASGDQYNLAANTAYAVSAQPDKIYATGKQMSGGLSKSITVVSQADVDKAKAEALAADMAPGKTEATTKIMSGYTAIENSFAQALGELSASPALDAEAPSGSGTVTIHLNYSLLAYNRADLVALGRSNLSHQITADMQIYDDGSGDAQIVSGDKPGSYHFVALAYVGSRIDTTKLTSSVVGKRYGDAVDLIGRLPGVEKVEVNLSPSWNTSLPLLGDHIRTTIKVSPKG